jgi:hypothetical protein
MSTFPGLAAVKKLRRRLIYLQWIASSEGPNEAAYLKRFEPSRTLLHMLRARSMLLKTSPPCREVFFFAPPPSVKARAVRHHAERFELPTFIETGTFCGDTTAAVASSFQRCITIELSDALWIKAKSRLEAIGNVTCLRGNSSIVLPQVLSELEGAALFWLDAHASGDNTSDGGCDPIMDELHAIFGRQNPRDVVLIDDARGHPIDVIRSRVPESHEMTVRNDIISG